MQEYKVIILIMKRYYDRFAISEIENNKILQWLFFALCFSFFATLDYWLGGQIFSKSHNYVCPSYFPWCGIFYQLTGLPLGYSYNLIFIGLYMLLIAAVFCGFSGRWELAHKIILLLWIVKVIALFVASFGLQGNYDYYDMWLGFAWLFATRKEYFAKLMFASFYFFASTIKIHEGWILGNYFNSIVTGAPIFPNSILPLFTNILIIMQMLGCWGLLSNNKKVYVASFAYFMLFHVYSGIIVEYRYLTISIPALLALFVIHKPFKLEGISKQTRVGYIFWVVVLAGQLISIIIPGDTKKTLEGNYYGMFMFEANHQCYSNATMYIKGGTTRAINAENHVSNNRCNPYAYWYRLRKQCNDGVERISWTFDHSINGHKYERIVDEQNLCSLTYSSFKHNRWIKLDGEARTLDIPVFKNGFSRHYLSDIPTKPIVMPRLVHIVTILYFTIWLLVLQVLVWKVWVATKANKTKELP
jgi:hypothetical protein